MSTSKKILIIRFSAIGDIVLTTPVLRCIAQQRPDIEIHYLTKPNFVFILQNNPYIHQIHSLQQSIWATAQQLKAYNFDYIIDLHHNQRTLLFKCLLRKPTTSFNKLNFEKFLATQFHYINRLPNVHIVDRYMAAVASLQVRNDHTGLDYYIPADQEVAISEHFPALRNQNYIALVIGAAHSTKRLPTAQLIELAAKIQLAVIILGGKDDLPTAEAIHAALPHLHNACGKFSLHQSASIVRQAHKVVAHDTGLMHIAAAFCRPIAVIWGNTIPEFGMYPYYPTNTAVPYFSAEVNNLSCRPCSKIGYDNCPKKHFRCMTAHDLQAIATWVNS